MRPLIGPALVGLLALGCSGALAKGDGRAFGEDMGRFHVSAKLDTSTCGAHAIGAPDDWQFDVVLSRDPPHLYWNTGANAVEGALDEDGMHFTLASRMVVGSGGASAAACAVVRDDHATGTLDDATKARHFDGTLEYRFAAEHPSGCSGLAVESGFAALPCEMGYRLAAGWVSDR